MVLPLPGGIHYGSISEHIEGLNLSDKVDNGRHGSWRGLPASYLAYSPRPASNTTTITRDEKTTVNNIILSVLDVASEGGDSGGSIASASSGTPTLRWSLGRSRVQ